MADGAQKYFLDPFAKDGDKTAIPNAAPIDGSVSYDIGFGIKYQQDPGTTGLDIPRNQFNQLMFDTTQSIQTIQQQGFPSWIADADGIGTPFAYLTNGTCRHNGVNYYSLVDANTDEPPSANWGVVSYGVQAFQSGDVVESYSNLLPTGWLWVDGKTIGDSISGATSRANADTIGLFTALWNSLTNAVCPIQNSDGSAGVRGISAAADFAANKRIPLIDKRGKVGACVDQFPGGVAAGILTGNTVQGVNGAIVGAVGGEQSHSNTFNENGNHSHGASGLSTAAIPDHTHVLGVPTVISGNSFIGNSVTATSAAPGGNYAGSTSPAGAHAGLSISGTTDSSGAGQAHNNVQPTVIAYFRIKM